MHDEAGKGEAGVWLADSFVEILEELCDDFGIGFAVKVIALGEEHFLEGFKIGDDAVVNDDKLGVSVGDVGVGVDDGGGAVGGPAGVGDADVVGEGAGLGERGFDEGVNGVLELVDGADGLEDEDIVNGGSVKREAGRVVAPVLEATQAGEKRAEDGVLGDRDAVVGVAEDAAHGWGRGSGRLKSGE